MAALCVSVCVTLGLMFVPGGRAVDLLGITTTSGDAPSPLVVSCRCSSYPDVTLCSWPQPDHAPPLHYIATYRERHGPGGVTPCTLNSSSSSSSSSDKWWCRPSPLKMFTDYIFNVTAVSPTGSRSHFSSFMLEDIVRPDPPVGVSVSVLGGRNLLLHWFPPSSWTNLDVFPLKYYVKYQWESRGRLHSVTVDPLESTSLELRALTGRRVYQFSVCAQELLGLGQCSQWTSPVHFTTPSP